MPADPNEMQVIASVPSEIEAREIVAALNDVGIVAVISGEHTSGFKAMAPGDVKVHVKHADASRAEWALQEIRDRSDAVDWSNVDVGRPDETNAAGGPYHTVLWGTIAGVIVAAVVPALVGGAEMELIYKSKSFWAAIVLCGFTSALWTAKTAFALGKRQGSGARPARVKERKTLPTEDNSDKPSDEH